MASTRRHRPTLKVKKPQVESLKGLSEGMTSIAKKNFELDYGLILNLLHVEIDDMALTTLAHFYDPPLRCFTFQDFQLAPTLEEFAKILGCNLEDHGPYVGLGEEPPMKEIAKALHLTSAEVSSWLEDKKNDRKGVSKGFSRGVLETKAQALLEKKDWKPFNAVLALLVYGLVLFPDVENFVDFSAIGVFIAGNPVSALLAGLYYSLHIKYEGRRKGMLFCCVPLLQEWLTSHLPRKDSFVSNPAGLKWHQRMMALTEKDIFWYSRELDGTEIILSCGDFPNVPLMGTRGCVNYNPVLAFRQLGYPMDDKPDNNLLDEFILKEGVENPTLLWKIRRAWGQIHKKPWTKKNCIAKPLYTQWVRDRVEANRLPFDMISELQKKNEDWESKYLQVEGKRARLERNLKYQEGVLQESQKNLRESEDKREKIGDGMLSARENLIAKDEEIERLKQSYGKIKEFGQSATASQKKWRLRYLEQVEETKKIKKQWRHEGNQSQEFEGLYTQEKARREYLQANMERVLAQKNQEFEEQLHLEVGRKQEFENLYFQERERCEHIQAEIEHILRVYEERVARLNEELEEIGGEMNLQNWPLSQTWSSKTFQKS
ncbi:hypothetical protein TSUD_415660 [Trifolium subterraneum]|uniref:DUF7745 domain-containing protein n=1 Tax=Trifolium subterraneum TaxID=3900 RepID=A0A2Z6PJJ6_TRISU|nr:hypothetical protein TSUD_415660 [Trifolium subterraneum]